MNQQRILPKIFQCRSIPMYNINNTGDRFIPQRNGYNIEISRLNLMDQESLNKKSGQHYFNVLHQVETINDTWRKRLMIREMEKNNIIRGIGSRKVLNFHIKSLSNEFEMPLYNNKREILIEESSSDDVWKIRARNRPMIGSPENSILLSGYRRFPSRGAIDWSLNNILVAAIEHKLNFFHDIHCTTPIISNIEFHHVQSTRIRYIKWNHKSDHLAVVSRSLHLVVYNVTTEKVVWRDNCSCEKCIIRCVCWSNNDREIITGCNAGRLSIFRAHQTQCSDSDRVMNSVQAHIGGILNIGFSPNNRYIVSMGLDKSVRIHHFPEMVIYLEIGYFDAVDAYAWHPWEDGILCIGGGIYDGSLSLWDIPRQQCIGYRRVNFLSYVKHLAWNKLSGELVVVWYYWEDEIRRVVVPVLSSWDRVVDVINLDQSESNSLIANVIWNPEHTIIGLQTEDHIQCFNMFGYNSNVWLRKTEKNRKKSAGQRSAFDLCCIR